MSSSVRFNGATTMVSWNGRTWRLNLTHIGTLQWGHDDGVVEWSIRAA